MNGGLSANDVAAVAIVAAAWLIDRLATVVSASITAKRRLNAKSGGPK